ncbi:MAG TPA: peptidylprolyl isomerase [Gemmataceae bacterium]|jgi:cyclophilin family peptidyl-prolyl cis-trans isomerase
MKRFLLTLAAFGVAAAAAKAANPVVVMETSMGPIKIELYEDKTPITVKNFLSYVDDKFYDNTIFHRVMGKENSRDDFMIQGGGFTTDKKEKKTKAPIKNESGNGLSNTRGTIAMARTDDPDSATAQFFINIADNSRLDHYRGGYAVFGKVIDGMDVVDKIKAVRTGRATLETPAGALPAPNVPTENVIIKSVRRADGK